MRQPLRRLGIVLSLPKSHRLPPTNSSQTTSAQSSKSKTTSKNSAKNKDFYTLSNRCENHIDFAPKAKDLSPEPHTKQVARIATQKTGVLSQQDAACASVTAQVAVSRECSLVLSKSPLSQALNRIYFPADVSGARHSSTYYVYFEPASSNHNQRPRLQMGDLSLISSMISWPALSFRLTKRSLSH